MKTYCIVVVMLISALFVGACNKEGAVDRKAGVAQIDGATVTVGQLEKEVGLLTGGNGQYIYPGTYETTLNRMLDLMIVEKEAKRRDLESSKEYREAVAAIRLRATREEQEVYFRVLADDLNKNVEISKAELETYYQQVRGRFLATMFHLRRIEVIDEKTIRQIKKKLASNHPFKDLASEFNIDPVLKKKGGDMGELARDEIPRALRLVAFSLREPNQVSEPFFADGKWCLLQFVSVRQGVERPMEQVKTQLEQELRRRAGHEALQKLLADNRKALKVEINQGELVKLTAARQSKDAPALAGVLGTSSRDAVPVPAQAVMDPGRNNKKGTP